MPACQPPRSLKPQNKAQSPDRRTSISVGPLKIGVVGEMVRVTVFGYPLYRRVGSECALGRFARWRKRSADLGPKETPQSGKDRAA